MQLSNRRRLQRIDMRIYSSPERLVRRFWEFFMLTADSMPMWGEIVLVVLTVACYVSLSIFLTVEQAHAQARTQDLGIQQAIVTQQILNTTAELTDAKRDIIYNRDRISVLADEVATMRGVGIGISFVLGLLQTIQMLLQVKTLRNSGGNGP